ncbi:hypothetical protein K461DRAFT_278089, partial [Myriangium duriaei CBS 260.36]
MLFNCRDILCGLLPLPVFASMAPADSTFTITIDGRPIAPVDEHAVDRTQAKLGSGAAVFSLKNDRLYSGDWILGRATRENRSFLP